MVGLRRVGETRILPYQRICQLTISDNATIERATGWFFGDTLVITAAHVFASFGADAQIEVCPAQSAAHNKPFGAWPAVTFRRSKDPDKDYAGVWLQQPVGASLGTFGIASPDFDLLTQTVDVTGYQLAETPDMWTVSGIVVNVSTTEIRYNMETHRGQSGAPVWLDGYPDLLVGLHSKDGVAIRLDSTVVAELVSWRQGPPALV